VWKKDKSNGRGEHIWPDGAKICWRVERG
jgi:hypothetical protein